MPANAHEYCEIELDTRSLALRELVIKALDGARRGHIGPSMSLIEILRVLYDDFLKFDSNNPEWEERDRLILSKGHGCLALYVILADKGFFPKEDLTKFCYHESHLGGHPEKGKTPGIEASTGALGHGLSIGVGMALAAKARGKNYKTVVITGDGELNEGSNWEAAMSCSKHNLDNIIVMVDYNKLQCYGAIKDVINLEPLASKWESFGFKALEVNGHDVYELRNALKSLAIKQVQPTVIICHTVKGKGFGFAEGNPEWHYRHVISDQDIERMRNCLK